MYKIRHIRHGAAGSRDAREPVTGKQKARVYAGMAAGAAVLCSLAVMTLSPAYSIPSRDSMYGPGAVGTLHQEDGVTDADLAMIEDVYSGAMASVDGHYCTEKYYQASPQGNWTRALEVCRFYSIKPGQIQLRYDPSGSGLCQVSVEIDGTDMDAVRAKEAVYLAEVDRLVAAVEGKTPEEKIRFFHDYLIGHCEYDYSLTKSRAYDCLVTGSSVCNGYAAAFYNLCRAAGLEAGYIAGTATVEGSGRIAHAWNRVKMEDGQWRYYDVTWDDETGSYRYYGLTEDEMSLNHFPEQVV